MNKKIIYTIGLILTLFFSQEAFADNYDFSAVAPSGQTLYYKITSDSTVMVTHPSSYRLLIIILYTIDYNIIDSYNEYTKPAGDLTIPGSVHANDNTYSVTSIDRCAFSTCTGLSSITIHNPVSSIDRCAFAGCLWLHKPDLHNHPQLRNYYWWGGFRWLHQLRYCVYESFDTTYFGDFYREY